MNTKSITRNIFLAITCIGFLYCSTNVQGQSKENSKSEATIGLSYSKLADMSRTAVAVIKAKNTSGKFVPAKNARVNFYTMHDKEPLLIKSINTNNSGKASIILPNDLPLDDSLYFTIIAKIENDPLYEDAQEQIHYADANLTVNLNPHDTARMVTAKVMKMGKDGKEAPVNAVEVKFYVQRLFGIMPAAEDYTVSTNANGEAEFTFPKNIPGDTAGSFTVVARMEENEQFGNVENKAVTSWGAVLAVDKNPFPRALWEPYAPMPLVITVSTLFGGVWCVYFYLFFQMWKIKQATKKQLTHT